MYRNKRFTIPFLLLFFVTITGCNSDVPISYSRAVPDSRMFGFWQDSDSTALEIRKNMDNSASWIKYYYSTSSGKYVADNTPQPIYFTTLTDGSGSIHFFSYYDDDHYKSGKIFINWSNELEVHFFGEGLLVQNRPVKEKLLISIAQFSSATNYQSFVRANMRNAELYTGHSYKFKKRLSVFSLAKPMNCTGSKFKVTSVQERTYIKDLKRWDDWTKATDVSGYDYTVRFFNEGIMVNMGQVSFNASDFSFVEKESSGYYEYSGLLKHDGQWAGNVTLWIYEKTYASMVNGGTCTTSIQMELNDVTFSNLFESAVNGANKVSIFLNLKNYQL